MTNSTVCTIQGVFVCLCVCFIGSAMYICKSGCVYVCESVLYGYVYVKYIHDVHVKRKRRCAAAYDELGLWCMYTSVRISLYVCMYVVKVRLN
jgi:hypothetical protein